MTKELPEYARELREILNREKLKPTEAARQCGLKHSTFDGIYYGHRKQVDDIGIGLRRKIYEQFKVPSFYSPFFDPLNSEKDEPRAQLTKYIVQHFDGSVINFVQAMKKKDIKVNKSTLHNFLAGRIKYPQGKICGRLYTFTGLECFKTNEVEVVPAEKTPQEQVSGPQGLVSTILNIERDLGSIKIALAQQSSSYEAAQLLQKYVPTPQERTQLVEIAIDVLVDQMDYFKTSPQEEREALVRHLRELGEVERWGYVVNLLQGINKAGNTPDTFARMLEVPKKTKRNR